MRPLAFAILLASAAACGKELVPDGPDGTGQAHTADPDDAGAAAIDAGGEGGSATTTDGGALALGADCNPYSPPCAAGLYCSATACGAGTCAPKPTADNDTYGPVCGCDGITYWNALLAASEGVSIRTSGPCAKTQSDAKKCDSLNPACPDGTFCGLVTITGACSSITGVCWRLPATCPSTPKMMGCTTGTCGSVCDAVRTEDGYYAKAGCN